jgi:transmembrane sensor
MDYSAYTVEDFISDPYFRKWVENPDQSCHIFWQEFMQRYPQKIGQVEDAREVLLFLSFDVIQPSVRDQQEVKAGILREIKGKKQLPLLNSAKHEHVSYALRDNAYAKAAVFIGVLVGAIALIVYNTFYQTITISTPYAQTRIIPLPDGSVVTLNANSTLRYTNNWTKSHKREVWLNGEAFFQVEKKPEWANASFTVHTDKLHVEVLGTTFNVNNRRGKVQVVLNTGKVKLKPVDNVQDSLTMQPKDLVEFTTEKKSFVKKRVNPEELSSWRNHKLVFNETPLQEIAQVLEDNYGVKIRFKEPGLRNRRFTGAIPNQNVNLLLSVLSQSMHIQMSKNNQTIIIQSNN